MPEGDTIFRTAVQLRKVLDGEIIADASGRWEIENAASLIGFRVTGIESRGKHLLIHFDDGRVVHSHMGMTGAWHIYRVGEAWGKSERAAALVLTTDRFCVVCFSPKLIELVSAQRLKRDEYLNRLGPDLLGPPVESRTILERFHTQKSVPIGQAVMNQTVICGIGNVYKSEVLFLEQIHPATPVGSLSDEQILAIVEQAVRLMRRNLEGHPRRTRFLPGSATWVYSRARQPCFKCGTAVAMIRQGDLGRSTYFCPTCQANA